MVPQTKLQLRRCSYLLSIELPLSVSISRRRPAANSLSITWVPRVPKGTQAQLPIACRSGLLAVAAWVPRVPKGT